MAEQVDLTTPDQSTPGTADYRVVFLSLTFEGPEGSSIVIILQGSGGLRRTFIYEGAIARSLLIALNTANLSTKSLQRRILERLIADGKLAGSISGAPDTV